MGIVRKHPFLTFVFVIGSLPVLFLIALEVAQHTPACSAWRAKVDAAATMYGKPSAFDDYHRGDMSWDEYYGNVRDQFAHDMRDTKPLFCE